MLLYSDFLRCSRRVAFPRPLLLGLLLGVLLLGRARLRAENAAFDLSGPRIEVRVVRANKSLPIAEVPNLQVGDRLWLHPGGMVY
jgi:hypothetical protein